MPCLKNTALVTRRTCSSDCGLVPDLHQIILWPRSQGSKSDSKRREQVRTDRVVSTKNCTRQHCQGPVMDMIHGLCGGRTLLVTAEPTVGFSTVRVGDTVVIWVLCQMLCARPGTRTGGPTLAGAGSGFTQNTAPLLEDSQK